MVNKLKRTRAPRSAQAAAPKSTTKSTRRDDSERIRRSLADAEHVQAAAVRNAESLSLKVGVTRAEIEAHAAVTLRVEATVDERGETEEERTKAAEQRDGLFQGARDLLGGVRSRAHLAFNLGVPRGKADDKALRAFGVGLMMPASVGGLPPALRRIERALKNTGWKRKMGERGFGAPQLAELRDAVAAAKAAAAGGVAVRKTGKAQRQTLDADVAEMRHLTAYLRGAGNTALGAEGRAEFDPPPAARARRPKEEPPAPSAQQ